MTELDAKTVAAWIGFLHGRSNGRIHINSPLSWTGRLFPTGDIASAVSYVTDLDRRGAQGIYLRCTTIRDDWTPQSGERGPSEVSASFPGFWTDIDIEGPGHRHEPNLPGTPGYDPTKKIKYPLPPDRETAMRILAEAGMPQPTTVIDSGGGLYSWWLLNEPIDLISDPAELSYATATSEAFQKLIENIFLANGYHYGNVGDLPRVLRIPGTVNRKVDGNPRPCTPVAQYRGGPRYSTDAIDDVIANVGRHYQNVVDVVTAEPAQTSGNTWSGGSTGSVFSNAGDSPFDDYENRTDWAEILEPAGWTLNRCGHGGIRFWTRPGKNPRDGWSATTGRDPQRDRLYVFSDATNLPANEGMNKGYVYAQLHHAGDCKAAAADLKGKGYGRQTPDREPPLPMLPPEQPVASQQPDQPSTPTPADAAWMPPKPLTAQGPASQPFPLHLLPKEIRDAAETIAASKQVAVELPALAMLSVVSGLTSHQAQVSIPNLLWDEPIVVNTLTALDSGERKSPAFKEITRPLIALQRRVSEQHAEQCEMEIVSKAQERGSGAAASGHLANRIEDELSGLEAQKKNPPRIMVSSDSTAEALVNTLHTNGGRGMIVDAEGSILGSIVGGRYTKGTPPNLEILLNSYDGQAHMSSRVTRGDQIIDRPVLPMALSVQGPALDALVNSEYATAKGLPARFILSRPDSMAGTRFLGRGRPQRLFSRSAMNVWGDLVNDLWNLSLIDDDGEPFSLCLSPQAMELFFEFHDDHEEKLTPNGPFSDQGIRQWAAKHVGRALRVAGLLHLVKRRSAVRCEIDAETMSEAIGICNWALAQAISILKPSFDDKVSASLEQAQEVLDRFWAKGVSEKRGVSIRDIRHTYIRASWATKAKIEDVMDILCEYGYARRVAEVDRNGVQRERFLIHPRL